MDIETFLAGERAACGYRCSFVAIICRPNVGNSTLMNHLIGQKVSISSKTAQTTRNRVTGFIPTIPRSSCFSSTPGFQSDHLVALSDRLNQTLPRRLAAWMWWFRRGSDALYRMPDRVLFNYLPKHTFVILSGQ